MQSNKRGEETDILIIKILNGTANNGQIEEFGHWIKDYENERYFEQFKEIWHAAQNCQLSEGKKAQNLKSFILYIRNSRRKQNNRKRRMYFMSTAAVVLLGFGLFILYNKFDFFNITPRISFSELKHNTDSIKVELSDGTIVNPLREAELKHNPRNREISYVSDSMYKAKKADSLKYNSVSIPPGERFAVVLSDGTKIFLSSNSYIRYPVSFGKESRTVTLVGRAYFDVTKSQVPFIVNTSDMKVEVLGTSFDVESNKKAKNSSVILVEGSVKVITDGQCRIIGPNEKFSINRLLRDVSISNVDSKTMTLWKEGILVLQELSFDNMIESLCSWYGVEITNNSTVSEHERFNGKFDRENIEAAMETIALSAKVRYRIEEGILIIEDNKE